MSIESTVFYENFSWKHLHDKLLSGYFLHIQGNFVCIFFPLAIIIQCFIFKLLYPITAIFFLVFKQSHFAFNYLFSKSYPGSYNVCDQTTLSLFHEVDCRSIFHISKTGRLEEHNIEHFFMSHNNSKQGGFYSTSLFLKSQPWVFIGRTDAEAEAPILWPPEAKNWLTEKTWCWERLKTGGEGDDRGWGGWMASPTWRTWIWASYGSWWWTGKPGVLQSMGLQRVGHDWETELITQRLTLVLAELKI